MYLFIKVNQFKRDQILNEIKRLSDRQEHRNTILIRHYLLMIIRILDNLQINIKEYLKIQTESSIFRNEIDWNQLKEFKEKHTDPYFKFTLGDLANEIDNIDYLLMNARQSKPNELNNNVKNFIHESDLLKQHIDTILFDTILEKYFKKININDIIKNKHCDIIIGYKKIKFEHEETILKTDLNSINNAETGTEFILEEEITEFCSMNPDLEAAITLEKALKESHISTKIIPDTVIINEEIPLKNNLIVIGGPRTNSFTYKYKKAFQLLHIHMKKIQLEQKSNEPKILNAIFFSDKQKYLLL